jgi:hypothetical protein
MIHRNYSYTRPPEEKFKSRGIAQPNHGKPARENGPIGSQSAMSKSKAARDLTPALEAILAG